MVYVARRNAGGSDTLGIRRCKSMSTKIGKCQSEHFGTSSIGLIAILSLALGSLPPGTALEKVGPACGEVRVEKQIEPESKAS